MTITTERRAELLAKWDEIATLEGGEGNGFHADVAITLAEILRSLPVVERQWSPHLDYAGEPMIEGQFRDPPQDEAVHRAHCFQGENDGCKYSDADCPATPTTADRSGEWDARRWAELIADQYEVADPAAIDAIEEGVVRGATEIARQVNKALCYDTDGLDNHAALDTVKDEVREAIRGVAAPPVEQEIDRIARELIQHIRRTLLPSDTAIEHASLEWRRCYELTNALEAAITGTEALVALDKGCRKR